SPHQPRAARPPANAPSLQRANHSQCTASIPCSATSPRSPAMSSASGAIASSPFSPPPPGPSATPSICSALPPSRRQTAPTRANHINGLRSKEGKVRVKGGRGGWTPAPAATIIPSRLSFEEMTEGAERRQSIRHDLDDRQHGHRQDRPRNTPHPIPEDQGQDHCNGVYSE